MNEPLRLGGYLAAVSAVAALALAGTNAWTAERIAAARAEKERAALVEVLPAAAAFESRGDVTEGRDASGAIVGYVLKAYAPGYSSRIEALVGVDLEHRVTGLKILYQNETPGLGTKIALPGFTAAFAGKAADRIRLKRDGGEIDAITAATISSRAITNAVRERIDAFKASGR